MKNLLDLTGKTAIVTGGSRGIGYALARGLHDAGAEVVIFYNSTPAQELAKEMQGDGAPVYAVQCDAADRASIDRAVDEAEQLLGGRIDILVNAAGINRRYYLEDFPLQAWDEVIATNLNGLVYCTQVVGKRMLAQNYGRVINVASLNSFRAEAQVGAYVAAKGGVSQITKAFANEWGGRGVRVNAIAPGYIKTDMTVALQEDTATYERILSRIPTGRWGTPEDLVAPTLLLASDAADYINGLIMPIDGGYLVT